MIFGLHFPMVSHKVYVKGQWNTFLSLSYTFPRCPIKGMLMKNGTLLSVFTKKRMFICSLMAPVDKFTQSVCDCVFFRFFI